MDGSIRLEKVGKCNMLKVVLNACASVVALEEASCVHHQIIECGWDSDSGTCECREGQKALELFQQMQHEVCDQTLLLLWGY